MKKKSLALIAIAVVMVASIATAYTLAYFTDSKSKENVFTVGDVKIKLEEPSWTNDGTKKIIPNVPFDKDPFVTNTGDNAAYVRMKVTINHADLFKKDAANTILGTISSDWTLVDGNVTPDKDNNITYVYTYNTKLEKNNPTSKLFTTVTLPAEFTNKDMEELAKNGGFKITVVAEAIQADGVKDSAEAFKALDDQKDLANPNNTESPT